jgi:small subunit ribosomal protein S16
MLRIRLARVGLKKQPSYRIVVIDSERARDSRYHEAVGFYNPRTQPETIIVKEDRVLYWLSVGAQPSDSAALLLKKNGTLDRFARLRKGESLEGLVAEAEKAQAEAPAISPKTRYPSPEKKAAD